MELIDSTPDGPPATIKEYPKWRYWWNWFWLRFWHWRLKRWIPRLVWLGDELDVAITFTQDRLPNPCDTDKAFSTLFNGGLFEIEKQLRHMGIRFDTGVG